MQRFVSPKPLAAIMVAWSVACVIAFFAESRLTFGFAYFVLPLSAFVIPLVVGALTASVLVRRQPNLGSANGALGKSVVAGVLGVAGYLLCFAVLARLLEIPWRNAKFGDPVLNLGASTAQFFVVLAALVLGAALLLLRGVPRRSWPASVAAACVGMVLFAGTLYLLVGISPLTQWRD